MTAPTVTHTRESWLRSAIEIFRPRFVEIGFPLPENVHISVGFPKGARAESGKILGVCYTRACSKDGVNHIFVSPESGDTTEILETVLHELVHAALDCEDGHKGRFAEAATRLGFEGPMTATPAGIALAVELMTIAETLGEYPHGQMEIPVRKAAPVGAPTGGGTTVKVSSGPGTQTTRLIKVVCPVDGCDMADDKGNPYSGRFTRKQLDKGSPFCPNLHLMQEA
ncbi:hypothetical protein AB0M54_45875 [Actinoplanes sp. NPDC051470]|uniref:hypothetical protein n=1 Tax=Actinoplanes sp. NPDC051470 TaxID=3157224 RepID=UPI00342387B9